jgi:hypothetical protein
MGLCEFWRFSLKIENHDHRNISEIENYEMVLKTEKRIRKAKA